MKREIQEFRILFNTYIFLNEYMLVFELNSTKYKGKLNAMLNCYN